MDRAQTSVRACWGYGLHTSLTAGSGTDMGHQAREGESPVHETKSQAAVSEVPRDTWNLVGRQTKGRESRVFEIKSEQAESKVHRDTWNLDGMSGDHPVRLNTP